MRRLCLYTFAVVCLAASLCLHAQDTAGIDTAEVLESRAATLRRELAASRRVGYLRRRTDPATDENVYVLKDAYDKKTYRIVVEKGLDLSAFVDRNIALYGETEQASDTAAVQFTTDRVTALDGKKPVTAKASKVRPAAFEADDARPIRDPIIEFPTATEDLRIAALTDGLPSPSEVLNENQPPLDVQIETIPEGYLVEEPVTNFDWINAGPLAETGLGGGAWIRGEYLLWLTDSLRTPALITTSPNGTPRATAGVLGEADTSVLYGGRSTNNDPHSGMRLRGGFWLNAGRTVGVEADHLFLGEQSAGYQASSRTGDPIIARPFFDIVNGRETAELVAFPNVVRGDIQVQALTNLRSTGIWMRFDPQSSGIPNELGSNRKLDWVLGYRYMKFEDDLRIREDLESLDPANAGTFVIEESFVTDNKFHGAEVGAVYEANLGRFFIEAQSKVAIGNNHQVVRITGFSDIDEMGVLERFDGGVLAQRTNIGKYERDELALIPQVNATVGWRVTPRLSLTAGYTFIYFSNVVRAGDQISTDINPNLFPPEANPFSGALRPAFAWRESDVWAHGMSFGGDFRW